MNSLFNNILVFQDAYRDSVEAMECASRITSSTASIKILDVQPPFGFLWQELLKGEFGESPVSHREKSLKDLSKRITFPTPNIKCHVRSGATIIQVVRETLVGSFDLVIKEAYEKTSDIIFGSLDMRLMRYCPIPVWIAHPDSPRECSSVLVAVNPEADETEMLLNKRLLKYASEVARGFSCKLFVVAAYQNPANIFPILDKDSVRRVEMHSKDVARKAREVIVKLLAECRISVDKKNLVVEAGWPEEVIVSTVAVTQPDLLILGSIARQGISGLLIGNVAERVLREVDCSVLTIKPANFVTPIQIEKPHGEELPNLGIAY